ncbi:hypothetical protein HDG37_006982 [Paraburkholderia sp. MM5384-R2]|nr:hypothetical protein [Paraburkholderia sp. MM5384-R2]
MLQPVATSLKRSADPCIVATAAARLSPKAAAGCMPARLRAIEPPQHRLPLLGREPGAVVGDRDADARRVAKRLDRYMAAFRRELDRIVDEIGQRFEQEVTVSMQFERTVRRAVVVERDALVFGGGFVVLDDVVGDRGEIHEGETLLAAWDSISEMRSSALNVCRMLPVSTIVSSMAAR